MTLRDLFIRLYLLALDGLILTKSAAAYLGFWTLIYAGLLWGRFCETSRRRQWPLLRMHHRDSIGYYEIAWARFDTNTPALTYAGPELKYFLDILLLYYRTLDCANLLRYLTAAGFVPPELAATTLSHPTEEGATLDVPLSTCLVWEKDHEDREVGSRVVLYNDLSLRGEYNWTTQEDVLYGHVESLVECSRPYAE